MAGTPKDKREAILQAALELVAERGFHGTPMAMVAQRAGVSAGIIYHYFASKEDLIHALYWHVKAAWSRALLDDAPPGPLSAEMFKQIWINAYHFYRTHPRELQFVEQYENSPFCTTHGVVEEAQTNQDMALLVGLLYNDAARNLWKDLPLEVLYELSLGAATRIAKRIAAGLPDLDDQTLAAAAAACWQAVAKS